MRFEELGEFQREMLAEAYRHQEAQRLRALIGVPVCITVSVLAYWFFIVRDDTGGGGLLGWPIILVLVGIAIWMTLETIANRRVRWILRGLNLSKEAQDEVVASIRRSPALAAERTRARSMIGEELKEGARRVRRMRKYGWLGLSRRD